jgi:hypothetical protein
MLQLGVQCTARLQMTQSELQRYLDESIRNYSIGPLYVPRRFTALPESGSVSSDLEFRAYGMPREREPALKEILTHPAIAIVADPGAGGLAHLLSPPDPAMVAPPSALFGGWALGLGLPHGFRRCLRLRITPQPQIHVFRHHHISHHHKVIPLAHFLQNLYQQVAPARRSQQCPPLKATSGDEVQMTGTVVPT